MKHYAYTLDLRDDPQLVAQYKEYHRQVWPEILARLRQVGITQMKIFLQGTRMFMYVEATDTFNPDRDLARYADHPRAQEWEKLMHTFQQQIPGSGEGVWWVPMEQVFEL